MIETKYALYPSRARELLPLWRTYRPSPLLTAEHNSGMCWIKDETARMGLGSFKALGGGYAVARLIEQYTGSKISVPQFREPHVKRLAKKLTFVCASAGNHGIAVAAGASALNANARIHLAKTVPGKFAERIRKLGAEVVFSGDDYEESVEAAASEEADGNGIVHLADGSWQGYTERPRLVMEGYTVLAEELRSEFEKLGRWPTQVFLQAGVGGMAAAIAYMIRLNWKQQPKIVIVEPEMAACLAVSSRQGRLTTVKGGVSVMGRLDCKAPSLIAFDILRKSVDDFVQVSDIEAGEAARSLGELGVKTTPSGAAGWAALKKADLNPSELPLVIATEGNGTS